MAQKTQLLVYTALETDQLKAYEQGFYREVRDVEIRWVRDSTGVITAKLLAEKANPQADVVMGVAASSLALLDQNGMLEPYAPINLDAIMSKYRDPRTAPRCASTPWKPRSATSRSRRAGRTCSSPPTRARS
jgi:iron(III) transport system substrate-binding protein